MLHKGAGFTTQVGHSATTIDIAFHITAIHHDGGVAIDSTGIDIVLLFVVSSVGIFVGTATAGINVAAISKELEGVVHPCNLFISGIVLYGFICDADAPCDQCIMSEYCRRSGR